MLSRVADRDDVYVAVTTILRISDSLTEKIIYKNVKTKFESTNY